jgi:hypothetical protein
MAAEFEDDLAVPPLAEIPREQMSFTFGATADGGASA